MLDFVSRVHQDSTPHNAGFSAYCSEENTTFVFNFTDGSDWDCISGPSRILFACDGIVFQSVGAPIHLTVSHDRMRDIFAKILNRRVFSRAVFESNIPYLSISVVPVASILRRMLAKSDVNNPGYQLAGAMLSNFVRLVAHVWPSTNSQELSLSPEEHPPLALRVALDYIYSKRGMVKSVVDVASVTNVGLRALETLFRDRMSIGIKRYCKSVMLRHITEVLESGNRSLSEIASEFDISNVARLRWEIGEYSRNSVCDLYPWEIYDTIRMQKSGSVARPRARWGARQSRHES